MVTPRKRKRNRSKSGSRKKRSKSQANTEKEAVLNPKKSSQVQDDPAPDKARASNQPAKEATPDQEAEGTQKNGEQLPKGQSNRRSSQLTGEQKSQEQENGVVNLTPVKNSKGKVCFTSLLGPGFQPLGLAGRATFRFQQSSTDLGAHDWPDIL